MLKLGSLSRRVDCMLLLHHSAVGIQGHVSRLHFTSEAGRFLRSSPAAQPADSTLVMLQLGALVLELQQFELEGLDVL